jgi:hypothetical protein
MQYTPVRCEFITVTDNLVAAQSKVRSGLVIFDRRLP